ncbi:hypothetical protein Leryth_014006 [Lithospermum erythrorhizon]|nr:hypothetical protein Leryth_014006 [Lithospermum erythrorhizon]
MPFPMKIQPIDSQAFNESSTIRNDVVFASKPIVKSRLKRLFDRPFTSVLRISSAADKSEAGGGGAGEFEPSSVCLDKMVRNFIEESNEKPSTAAVKCSRNRCNCFNGSSNDSSDDEFGFAFGFSDSNNSSFTDSSDVLKSLIPCPSIGERNLLADTSKIVEKNKACKRKDDLRKIVTDNLISLNYDAAICKSKWEKSSSIPAGEYEYIDVIIEGERILIDVDFRSEFEIARSTGSYKAVLQSVPSIFVGKTDRLSQIVSIVSEAAKLSLKKKGMHIAPWRKADYIKSKWLSSFTRITPPNVVVNVIETPNNDTREQNKCVNEDNINNVAPIDGEDLMFEEKTTIEMENSIVPSDEASSGEEEKLDFSVKVPWEPPPLEEKSNKLIVTGLASLLNEKP